MYGLSGAAGVEGLGMFRSVRASELLDVLGPEGARLLVQWYCRVLRFRR